MVGPSPQVREINRALLSSIRTDFVFPAAPTTPSSTAAEEDTQKERAIFARAQGLVQDVDVYRERYYGSSEDDSVADDWSDSEEEDDEGVKSAGDVKDGLGALRSRALSGTSEAAGEEGEVKEEDTGPKGRGIKASLWKRGSKTYRGVFSSPHTVAEEVLLRQQRKKRRKWRMVQEEMAWNEGLCFFERRRNAWTGAVASNLVDARGHLKPKEDLKIIQAAEKTYPQDHLEGAETTQKPDDTTADPPKPEADTTTDQTKPEADREARPGTSPPVHVSPFAPPSDTTSITHISIPVMHPLLSPTNTVRSTILTRSLSELYDKIVRDSRTPAVPINLAHIMRVIVKGWIDEGNWPPKGNAAPEPMIASRRSRAADSGGGDVKKVLRRAGGRTGSDAQRQEDEAKGGLLANHRHLRQGVESMKKAFRLSGSGVPGD